MTRDYSDRPTARQWADRLGLRPRSGQFEGPCPRCGGTDRFFALDTADRDGVIHCRKCGGDPDFYAACLAAAGFRDRDDQGDQRRALQAAPPPAEPSPADLQRRTEAERARQHKAAVARRALDAAGPVPDDVAAGWRLGLLLHAEPAPGVNWLDADGLRRAGVSNTPDNAIGALVTQYGDRDAAHFVFLDEHFGKAGGKGRDKTNWGQRVDGDVAPCVDPFAGTLRRRTLIVVEGLADALAATCMSDHQPLAAIGARTIMGKCARHHVRAEPDRWSDVLLVPDHEDPDSVTGAQNAAYTLGPALSREIGSPARWHCMDTEQKRWRPDLAAAWEQLTRRLGR